MSLLIAESGGTKTDWFAAPQTYFTTTGLNPNTCDAMTFRRVLAERVLPHLALTPVQQVFFYGAGCATPPDWLGAVLGDFFPLAAVEIQGDLLAAARASTDGTPSIIGLLGTGAHAGYFNGTKIEREATNLGYLLGDEGSGADLGKAILRAYFYDKLPPALREAFHQRFGVLRRAAAVQKLYQAPHPNRWLAQFAPFLVAHQQDPFFQNLLLERLRQFFAYHLVPLQPAVPVPVALVGGLAAALSRPLAQLIREYGWSLTRVVARPLPALVAFHQKSLSSR